MSIPPSGATRYQTAKGPRAMRALSLAALISMATLAHVACAFPTSPEETVDLLPDPAGTWILTARGASRGVDPTSCVLKDTVLELETTELVGPGGPREVTGQHEELRFSCTGPGLEWPANTGQGNYVLAAGPMTGSITRGCLGYALGGWGVCTQGTSPKAVLTIAEGRIQLHAHHATAAGQAVTDGFMAGTFGLPTPGDEPGVAMDWIARRR